MPFATHRNKIATDLRCLQFMCFTNTYISALSVHKCESGKNESCIPSYCLQKSLLRSIINILLVYTRL